jgi:hypothetical protein
MTIIFIDFSKMKEEDIRSTQDDVKLVQQNNEEN